MNTVTVPIKSAWASKVNWVVVLGGILALLNEALPLVPANDQNYVTGAITILTTISAVVARTFYTTSLTQSSAAKVQ